MRSRSRCHAPCHALATYPLRLVVMICRSEHAHLCSCCTHRYTARILRKIGYSLADLVIGRFSAGELKDAGYSAYDLRQADPKRFTAHHMHVAGFTSRELRAARYTLTELQAGGYSWAELVIFLRATYTQLVAAGFTMLDRFNLLFLQYSHRPEDERRPLHGMHLQVHDVSILSPRYRMFSPRSARTPRSARIRPMGPLEA